MSRCSPNATPSPSTAPTSARTRLSVRSWRTSRAAGGAEGGAYRQLFRPGRAAREQKIRDVAARDEQDEAHRAEQRHEQLAEAADELIDEWSDAHAIVGHWARAVGRLLGKRALDGENLVPCLLQRSLRPQSSKRAKESRSAHQLLGRERKRDPEIFRAPHVVERRRHHADDRVWHTFQLERAPDDASVAIVAAGPQPVTDDDDARCARTIFVSAEGAAQNRLLRED